MNLSLCRVESAWRRACRSPRLASVIICSTSGLTAFAFAWLVLIRSCSISCLERLESSDSRCDALRLSLLRFLRWRIGVPRSALSAGSVLAQVEAAGLQGLDHFVDRLRAEVRDRVQLRAGFADQVADGLHAGTLEAVVGAHAELQLLDQDLVEAVVGRDAAAVATADRSQAVTGQGRRGRFAGGQLLDPLGVGEDRQGLDQDLRGLAQRRRGLERAVGLEVEAELVEVRPLADAGGRDIVGGATDRREDRVDRDHADRLLVGLVLFRRRVAAAAADRQVDLELGFLLQRRDRGVGVENLHSGREIDVLGLDLAGPGGDQRRLDLVGVGVHADDEILQVEDDVGDVLLDARHAGELVRAALDADAGDGGAAQRGEQDSTQAIAEGVAEALVEGLDREGAAAVIRLLYGDTRDLKVSGHEFLADGVSEIGADYLEYSSTISCSCTGAEISARSGRRRTLAVSESWSACNQAGTVETSSVALRIVSVAAEPDLIEITSSGRTW